MRPKDVKWMAHFHNVLDLKAYFLNTEDATVFEQEEMSNRQAPVKNVGKPAKSKGKPKKGSGQKRSKSV